MRSHLSIGKGPRLLAAVALALTVGAAQAQRPRIEVFDAGDGVPTTPVVDFAQDASGRLYLLSREYGLTTYDGERFTSFPAPPGSQAAIESDPTGRIWAATRSPSRLHVLEGSSWRTLPDPPLSGDRAVWVSSLVMLPGEHHPRVQVGTVGGGVLEWNGKRWRRIGIAEGLVSGRVLSLAPVGEALAIGTDAGLCLLAGDEIDCGWGEREPALAGPLFALRYARGELWVLGRTWMGSLEVTASSATSPPRPALPLRIHAEGLAGEQVSLVPVHPATLLVDPAGGVFYGFNRLHHLDPDDPRPRLWGETSGLPYGAVSSTFLDREGNLWIGTWRGIGFIESLRFRTFDRSQGLLEDEVTAIAEPRPGRMLLAHNEGVSIVDGERITHVGLPPAPPGAPRRRVRDLVVDGGGRVWAVIMGHGLMRLAEERWIVALEDKTVQSLEIDATGRLWLASAYHLYEWRDGRAIEVVPEVELDGVSNFRWLHAAPDGRLMIASRGGGLLWREPQGGWHLARAADPEANDIFNVLATTDRVWVGTTAGLYELAGNELRKVREGALDVDRPIYLIVEDHGGRLWLGTDDGLRLWDGSRLRRFGLQHGLPGRESNRGAGLVDSRGRVWLGSEGGASIYHESYDLPPAVPPRVEVATLSPSGERLAGDDGGIALDHHNNSLTFRVQALALRREEDLVQRYRLEGFDAGWVGPAPYDTGEIRYTNLPAGDYRFRVTVGWPAGPWSEEAVSAPVLVTPPLWRRPWFVLALVALVGTATFGGFQVRTRALRRRARDLEALNARLRESNLERQHLITDLEAKNAELERFSYTVSHDLKSPLVTIRGFLGMLKRDSEAGDSERVSRDIERIAGAAETMNRHLDELLELSRVGRVVNPPEKVDLAALAREAAELAAARIEKIGAEVIVDPDLPTVRADRARLLEVLLNLIENAAKYMGDQRRPRIEIGHRVDGGETVFFVTDNGIGIEPAYQDRVFGLFDQLDPATEGSGVGLALARRIIEVHHGRLWVESGGPASGSTFCFTLGRPPKTGIAPSGGEGRG